MIHDIHTIRAKEPETLRQFLRQCHAGDGSFKRRVICCENAQTGEKVRFERYEKVKA